MDLGLRDARVLVAASSQGLGWATARQFSLEGARVAINGRDAARLEEAARIIRAEGDGEVLAVPGDLNDRTMTERLVDEVMAGFGGLDVLVTNAGGPPSGTFASVKPEQYRQAFELTFMSAVYLIRAALPHLKRSDRPAILTISSVSVKQPVDNLILSNSVRMAVAGLTKSLADELGPQGIRVNSILPGFTRTARVDELLRSRAKAAGISLDDAAAERAASVPLKRIGTPQEFANVAVFLCSPAAGYVHGAMIPVDGGSIRATL